MKLFRSNFVRPEIETLEERQLMASSLFSSLSPAVLSTSVIPAYTPKPAISIQDVGKVTNTPTFALLSTLPQLNSNPGASASLYLNFLGDFRSDWFYVDGDTDRETHFKNINIPVFDLDGNAAKFSAAEQDFIRNIWERVAEDFAPFNINVTTVYPGNLDNGKTMMVNIGGSNFLGTGNSGYSSIGSFTDRAPNAVYVFAQTIQGYSDAPAAYSNDLAAQLATTASHEAGHSFGLFHQVTLNDDLSVNEQYNPGNGIYTPIMGNNLATGRTTWYDGFTGSAPHPTIPGALFPTFQWDMATLARPENGFGFRADDVGDSRATAKAISGAVVSGPLSAKGLIGNRDDVDAFSFFTGSGAITVRVDSIARGANLDARVELWSSSRMIASADPGNTLGAQLSANVAAGKYFVLVKSHGQYGDVGQYTLTVNPVSNVASRITVDTVGLFSDSMVSKATSMTTSVPPIVVAPAIVNPIPVPDPAPLTDASVLTTRAMSSVARVSSTKVSALDQAFLKPSFMLM